MLFKFVKQITARLPFSQTHPHQKKELGFPEGLDHKSFTAVIPVYGNLSLFSRLLASMEEDLDKGLRLIVVDDAIDNGTSLKLSKMLVGHKGEIHLVKNPNNLGYLRSINKAVSLVGTRYTVLLNTDVEVPAMWLERFAFSLSQPKVALATPLATESGANLTLEVPHGMHWTEADELLQCLEPSLPDSCTAIGYAMGIDLSRVGPSPVFDENFHDGYGEDSDLHYRVINAGFRSVVVDNLLVKHGSGASYNHKPGISAIKEINRKIFFERWGKTHRRAELKWIAKNPVAKLQRKINLASRQISFSCDILIVVPSTKSEAGGIQVLNDLWDICVDKSLSVRMMDLESSAASQLKFRTSNYKTVVATGIGTFKTSKQMAKSSSANLVVLLQGPEYAFSNGAFFELFKEVIAGARAVISVSAFLTAVAKEFDAMQVFEANLGPDDLTFYPSGADRKRQIVISSRKSFEKGTVFAAALVRTLHEMGWDLVSVGSTHQSLAKLRGVTNLGHVDANVLRKVFSESLYALDFSLMEGLGLFPLEAAACGCVPIYAKRGGGDELLEKIGALAVSSAPASILEMVKIVSNERIRVPKVNLSPRRNALSEIAEFLSAVGVD